MNSGRPQTQAARAQVRTRIPSTLQAVFLASNRGSEVHKPPPKRDADRTYFRGFIARTFSGKHDRKLKRTKVEQSPADIPKSIVAKSIGDNPRSSLAAQLGLEDKRSKRSQVQKQA